MVDQQELNTILERIKEHIEPWKSLLSTDYLEVQRMSGLSNACFRVHLKDGVFPDLKEPRTLLYRRFVQELTDRRIEQTVYAIKAEDGTGPTLHF